MIHVLLVDDGTKLRSLVADDLQRYGMRVTAVASGTELRCVLPTGAAGSSDAFDVPLLDPMLPDANGLDRCRWVRSSSTLPIIMLTAQGDPASRIVGHQLGADDYLPEPFELRELVARINAVMRRSGPRRAASAGPGAEPGTLRHFKSWAFGRLGRQLRSPQRVNVALSSTEFRLRSALVEHPRRVLSCGRLFDLSHAPGGRRDRTRDRPCGVTPAPEAR